MAEFGFGVTRPYTEGTECHEGYEKYNASVQLPKPGLLAKWRQTIAARMVKPSSARVRPVTCSEGLGFWVWGLRLRVWALGYKV